MASGSFEGKAGVITGGGSGIGRATAVMLAKEGMSIAIGDVDTAGGEETVAMAKAAGGRAIFVKTDVAAASDVRRLIESARQTFGNVYFLHNNAGLMKPRASFEEFTEADWDHVVEVSLKGSFLGAQFAWPIMQLQGGGVIVNMSSMGAVKSLPVAPSYGAAKSGVIHFTRSLADLGKQHNIRSNCILPGSVATHFRDGYPEDVTSGPMKNSVQTLEADDIARAVRYFVAERGVTGQSIRVLRKPGEPATYEQVASYEFQWERVPGLP